MDLQYTLREYILQLKNTPRTLLGVAGVVQKIMKTLYDVHFPNAEDRRPSRNPECPDSDILSIGWKPLEYVGADSEHSGYKRLKVELQTVFPCLPERSRFNRRRRNLSTASEVLRQALTTYFPKTDVFLVDSFPMILGDKGYVSEHLHRELLETENICLFAPRRSNQKQQYPQDFRKLQVRLRRRIETTLNQVTQQFSLARVRARTQWDFRPE